MELKIRPMDNISAQEISSWHYDGIYEYYDMDSSEESIDEFMNGSYYKAVDDDENLVGFYCFGTSAQIPSGNLYGAYDDKNFTDIGLGLRPDLCGKGLGYEFFIEGMKFACEKLSPKMFRLTVAAFNNRAVRLYESAGFRKVTSFERVSDEGNYLYITMELDHI